ncbi:MAG: DNA-3-methyladenine glycosylase 2 family protein [Acidimicrobiales bacterium]|nr:DNA-3-methyladenine glycosylase 2 family protein [Acidimicrobiales bacterium]MCB1016439.1 DNA-3-methyladenine glycosylase 2 family protein [Acidimicrobiales bacterium]
MDLALTLGPLRRGRYDPTCQIGAAGLWRATRTPEGAATLAVVARDGPSRTQGTTFDATAWGAGAEWALDHAPALLGAEDDPTQLSTDHPLVARLHRRFAAMRIPRSNALFEALVPTIIEQKVTGFESRRAYRQLVQRLGDAAPGPTGLSLPPDPATIAGTPYYDLHLIGVERKRADTLRRVAARAPQIERLLEGPPSEARRALARLRGIGPWSAAEVAFAAFGDPDAVSVGDYHLPHQVAYALAGEERATDERMLELLEPFRGQRGRVVRLIEVARLGPARKGPRMGPNDFRDR